MIIILFSMVVMALAEPPISGGYDNVANHQYLPPDFPEQLSRITKTSAEPSSQYPSSSLNEISRDYGSPSFRSEISREYGTPARSLSQEYGVPVRSTAEYETRSGGVSDYNHSKAGISQVYGVPREFPSTNYVPQLRDISQQYGVPDQYSTSNFVQRPKSNRSSPAVQKYGVPIFKNRSPLPQSYQAPTSRSSQPTTDAFRSHAPNSLSKIHSTRKASETYGTKSLSRNYDGPEINKDSYNQKNSQSSSDSYQGPESRSISRQYGTPETRNTGSQTYDLSSSLALGRSSSSHGYEASARTSPSQEYGTPNEGYPEAGYSKSRQAIEELLNQESAAYEFGYKVNDFESGSDFGHTEIRQSGRAEGSYFVVLPDGTKQIVEYEADERGFKPRISVEAANVEGPY